MVRYRATTAEDGHATEPGAFTIANYGKVNPTLVDGVKVTPEGRELVLPHGAVFTVADRSFRVEYVWGRTPGHAAAACMPCVWRHHSRRAASLVPAIARAVCT